MPPRPAPCSFSHDCSRELLQGERSFVIGKREERTAKPKRSVVRSDTQGRHADAMIVPRLPAYHGD